MFDLWRTINPKGSGWLADFGAAGVSDFTNSLNNSARRMIHAPRTLYPIIPNMSTTIRELQSQKVLYGFFSKKFRFYSKNQSKTAFHINSIFFGMKNPVLVCGPDEKDSSGSHQHHVLFLAAKEREETPRKEEGKKSGEEKVSTIVAVLPIYQKIKTRKHHTYWAAPRSREHREGRRQGRPKFEARSTKYETNPKYKCSKSKTKAAWYDASRFFSFWSLEFRSFEFVSNFDIRISDLRTLTRPCGQEISVISQHPSELSTLFKGELLLLPALRLHLWSVQCFRLADCSYFSFLSIIPAVLSNGLDERAPSGPPQHHALLIRTSIQINKLKEVFLDRLTKILTPYKNRAVSGPGNIILKKYPGLRPHGFLFLTANTREETRRRKETEYSMLSPLHALDFVDSSLQIDG